jgi:hypothetical protein
MKRTQPSNTREDRHQKIEFLLEQESGHAVFVGLRMIEMPMQPKHSLGLAWPLTTGTYLLYGVEDVNTPLTGESLNLTELFHG